MARRKRNRPWGYAWEHVLTNHALSSHATRLHSYLDILVWRNSGKPVNPTMPELTDALGLSGDVIRRARRELEAEGLVTARRRKGGKVELSLASWDDAKPGHPDEAKPGHPDVVKPGHLSRERDPYSSKAERARANALARGGVRERNLVFDALAEACGYRETLLDSSSPIYDKDVAREIGVAQARIREKAKGLPDEALAQEVHLRAALYQDRWPEIDLTPFALARRWNDVTRKKPRRRSAVDKLREEAQ
jgi:hypothetical protein